MGRVLKTKKKLLGTEYKKLNIPLIIMMPKKPPTKIVKFFAPSWARSSVPKAGTIWQYSENVWNHRNLFLNSHAYYVYAWIWSLWSFLPKITWNNYDSKIRGSGPWSGPIWPNGEIVLNISTLVTINVCSLLFFLK